MTMTDVFGVSTGDYEDYCVLCIFEHQEDARAYAEASANEWLRSVHETIVAAIKRDGPMRGFTPHTEPESDCAVCADVRNDWRPDRFGGFSVEEFRFYPSGTTPAAVTE